MPRLRIVETPQVNIREIPYLKNGFHPRLLKPQKMVGKARRGRALAKDSAAHRKPQGVLQDK
jgi:hypothetical protein